MPKILLGFMGAGKTTIGRLLDPNFHDMDAELVLELGMPVSQYFATYGEENFRSQESAYCKKKVELFQRVVAWSCVRKIWNF